jgi:hypothetical protein
MRLCAPLALLISCVSAAPAAADATAFIGVATPDARRTVGFAIGAGLLIVGFEFEYAHVSEDLEEVAPSLRTYMGNLLLQTPLSVGGVQLYGTVGAGVFRESFENADSETHVGTNLGGGVKIGLAGPLRLRLDYRVFMLQGTPLYDNPQRFYAGLNLAF